MGGLLDLKLEALAYIVPTGCFAYLLLLSLRGGKRAPALETAPAA